VQDKDAPQTMFLEEREDRGEKRPAIDGHERLRSIGGQCGEACPQAAREDHDLHRAYASATTRNVASASSKVAPAPLAPLVAAAKSCHSIAQAASGGGYSSMTGCGGPISGRFREGYRRARPEAPPPPSSVSLVHRAE